MKKHARTSQSCWQGIVLAAWCLWLGVYTKMCEADVATMAEHSTPEATLSRALAELEMVDSAIPNSVVATAPPQSGHRDVDLATSDMQLVAWIMEGGHPTEELLRNEDLNPAHLDLGRGRRDELEGISRRLQLAADEYLLRLRRLAGPDDGLPHFSLPAPDGREYKAEDWLGGARRIACEEAHVLFRWFASAGCPVDAGAETRVVRRLMDAPESVLLGLVASGHHPSK